MKKISGLAVTAIVSVLLSATSTYTATARDRAPLGLQLFCLENPSQCRGGGSSTLELSARAMALISQVNTSVNRSIKPRRDTGPDRWQAGSRWGDCEDYVLTKRRELIRHGLPAGSLRIAFVQTRRGEGHALLVVKSDRGNLALDNLTSQIVPLEQTGHRLVSMSGSVPTDW